MRIQTCLVLCVITITGIAQQQKTTVDKRLAGLDTAFQRVLKEQHAAGFAVAIVEKNKVLYSKGFGYRDYENKIPVTANTLFAIGSCTKAFTSSLLGMLQTEGKVDYDKTVRTYLPQFGFYNSEMNDHITVRDLMCHRTGLPRHDLSWYAFQSHSKDSLVQRIQYLEPSAGLREKWQYNNFMFLLQGVIVEKLTGKSWEDNIRERIFKPLGMDNSNVSLTEWTKASDASFGYDVKKDSIINKVDYYDIAAMAPAGSINSSVNDMAKWVISWINGGNINGKELLPKPYIKQAITVQMATGGGFPGKTMPDINFSGYGFGWVLESYRGHYSSWHDGGIDGFTSVTGFYPTDSIGFIILTNQGGSAVPYILKNIIADKMLGLKYHDWETESKRNMDSAKLKQKKAQEIKPANLKKVTKPLHLPGDYPGTYFNAGYGTLSVKLNGDSFFVSTPTLTFWLRHEQYDIFTMFNKQAKEALDTTNENTKAQFITNVSGSIESVSINLEFGVKPIIFTRSLLAKEISKDSLQVFTGEYDISGTLIKIYVKSDNLLYMFVTGQPEYELVPIDKDKFAIKILSGYQVQFNRNEKGEVIEALSIQPNGTFKAVKKR